MKELPTNELARKASGSNGIEKKSFKEGSILSRKSETGSKDLMEPELKDQDP